METQKLNKSLLARLEYIIASPELTAKFRKRYATEFDMIKVSIINDNIKAVAVEYIVRITNEAGYVDKEGTDELMNGLTLKALLLDTITYLKTGNHLHRAYLVAKHNLCRKAGQPTNINSRQLLTLLCIVYQENGEKHEREFWNTVIKHDAAQYVIIGD